MVLVTSQGSPARPTCGTELVDVLKLKAIQRNGLVHHGEGTALLQELIQLQGLSLLRGSWPLGRPEKESLHERIIKILQAYLEIQNFLLAPICLHEQPFSNCDLKRDSKHGPASWTDSHRERPARGAHQVCPLCKSWESNIPFCFSLSWWSRGIHQTGTDIHRPSWCSLVIIRNQVIRGEDSQNF